MNKKPTPLVSISLLNWNGLEDTKKCLESLQALNYPNYEVIVVDNGSSDGSKEYLANQRSIIFVDLPKNTGFTGGHLAAAEVAKGEYLLIFNNDLVVDQEWINKALGTFWRHEKASAVSGKLFKWNDENPLRNKSNDYYAYQEVNQKTGNTYTLLVGEQECRADSVSGAALMMKKSVLDEVGYFDDDFFAYYEETDLIARMLRAGYEAYYNPEAMAWHKIAASSKGGEESPFYLYMMHRNRYLYVLKNFDDEYLSDFKKSYRKEVLKQLVVYARRQSLESKMRIKAYWWNKKNGKKILKKRGGVLSLGPSYNGKLHSYKPSDVTIIIPCHNYGNFVSEAIESALSQTLKPSKIIIINDGSTDNSQKVIDQYKNNPLIEIIHQQNQGIVATKNIGLEKSQTYWTIFFDADDVIDKEYIEKLVNLANEGPYDVVYTDMEYFGAVSDIFRSRPFSIFPMLSRNFVHNSALIKTSRLKQVGGYKAEMRDGLEDWELYLSLYEIGSSFGYLPEAIFKYRQHEGTLSRNIEVQKNRELDLYNRLRGLHPRLFQHMNPSRRRALRVARLVCYFVRYPYLFIVLLKSLPRSFVAGIRSILHDVRAYLRQKELKQLPHKAIYKKNKNL